MKATFSADIIPVILTCWYGTQQKCLITMLKTVELLGVFVETE